MPSETTPFEYFEYYTEKFGPFITNNSYPKCIGRVIKIGENYNVKIVDKIDNGKESEFRNAGFRMMNWLRDQIQKGIIKLPVGVEVVKLK